MEFTVPAHDGSHMHWSRSYGLRSRPCLALQPLVCKAHFMRWSKGSLAPHPSRGWSLGRFVLVASSLLFWMTRLTADVLPGADAKEWAANPNRHVVMIQRTPADRHSLKMINRAENASSDTNTWFKGTRLGVLLPYALSGQALEYYERLIDGYRNRSWKTHIEPHSLMDYSAVVTHHDVFERDGKTFRDVDVVEMKLTFQADFTQEGTQGIRFKKTRAVVLDGKGSVLAVFGDGLTEAPILAI